MRLAIIAALAAGLVTTAAKAEDAKPSLTIEQCLNILYGLNSLSYVGQQLGDLSKPPADAKQYKLGPARLTIGLNIAALTPIQTQAQNAQNGFIRELPPLPAADPKNPNSAERVDAAQEQNRKSQANWEAIIHRPCSVYPAHLKASELKIGDGDGENAFPPPVIGAIAPIIDGITQTPVSH